ncbi:MULTISPECIES: class I SAM-dependent methyltransferase [unclassified Bradyrhizobium]|uniref:class I SAM-dependent methyltransferase n=1 Tax=unclassified Bradyrhizobium TaxID=2631580 RepID=UPI002916907C|nr:MULTISPECIES: class I SAM-dependent methyltransferase [unclassified Bradyrhizobium]
MIRQVPGKVVELNYHGIFRGTAKQLPHYAEDIMSALPGYGVQPGDLVLEVGANDGTFLRELRNRGYHNLLGVEPSTQLAEFSRQSGLEILNAYFDRRLAAEIRATRGPVRAVICRHTLEHVPDIREFTQAIADVLADDAISLIEVPDADWVVTNLFAHEIWDEHITYFRNRSLARIHRDCGLAPVNLQRQRFRDTRNLLCWSRPARSGSPAESGLPEDEADFEAVAQFQSRWDALSARLRTMLRASPKPVVGIGASHIQLNFLNFAGLGDLVDVLVDDDTVKAGRFAPLVRPVPIRSTAEILASMRQGTLLRMAFPYPQWEDRIEGELRAHGVVSIRPYDVLQAAQ